MEKSWIFWNFRNFWKSRGIWTKVGHGHGKVMEFVNKDKKSWKSHGIWPIGPTFYKSAPLRGNLLILSCLYVDFLFFYAATFYIWLAHHRGPTKCRYYHDVCKAFVLIFWSWNFVIRSWKSHGKVMEFCPGNFVATLVWFLTSKVLKILFCILIL